MHTLHELTEGNPFYSDEVVRLLVAQGRIDQPLGERVPLPDGVRDAIRKRLLPLRPEVRDALQVAAVEGRDFQLTTVERAAGIARADLLERLDEALAVQLLEEAPGPAGSFRFVARPHPRDALRRPHRLAPRARCTPPWARPSSARPRPRPSWPTTSSRRRRSATRPRRSSMPSAPATRRWRRWPTSAPPTSSTPP